MGRRRAAGSRRGRPIRRAMRRPPKPAMPTDVSSMQPRNVWKPSSRARLSIALAGPIPPHLASFTLTPSTTPTRASRSSSVTALSSATIGIDDRSWSQREIAIGAGRERLLDELDAEIDDRRQQALGVVARPARVGVDADRAAEDLADGPQGLEVLRPAALDLERREIRGSGGALGDDRRLVDADREVGRRDLGRKADQLVDRDPSPCRPGRGGRCRARTWRRRSSGRRRPCRATRASCSSAAARSSRSVAMPSALDSRSGMIAAIVSGVSP